jgi:hypothetical protein
MMFGGFDISHITSRARNVMIATCALALLAPQVAQAQCVQCAIVEQYNQQTRDHMEDEHDETRDWIDQEFDIWEDWLENTFVPAFNPPEYIAHMAEQVTTTAVYQVFAIGTLLDAKQSLEVQRIFQKKVAEAHRDYQPSVGVCTVGTTVRSLAAAERRAETTTFVLSQRAQDRQIGNMHSAGAGGGEDDKKSRLEQFRRRYCDTRDHNGVFMSICRSANGGRIATLNKDIDYNRTVDRHRTMNINFTDNQLTEDEEDVMALASNLYSHELFNRTPEKSYNDSSPQNRDDRLRMLLEQRQIIAKRSVAENSYNTIVGLKSLGSPASGDAAVGSSVDTARYLRIILQQLGMNAQEINLFLGQPTAGSADNQPSYFAQMEILTKKAFQQPTFYADLYDKPANVDRKKVALQAIGLMQDFDTWQSYLRIEAILSILLETEVERYQGTIENPGSAGGGGLQ